MKTFQTTHFHHTNGKKTPFMFLEKQADNWFVLTNQKGFNIYCEDCCPDNYGEDNGFDKGEDDD